MDDARRDETGLPSGLYRSGPPQWMRRALDERRRREAATPDVSSTEQRGPMALARRFRVPALLAVVALGLLAVLLVLQRDPPAATLDSLPAGPPPVGGGPALTGEPVAAVARALLPSVVQIEAGGGVGSGVIYNEDGLILTAAHVVERAAPGLTVRLADGTRIEGDVVGTDDGTDVAVVRVPARKLPAATLAIGVPVRVGQLAVAIGGPFGLEGSVTAGVVSAVDRSLPSQDGVAMSMIQTDAPINPGSSGGALADRRGRVIGISNSIRSSSGVNSGVGFAIPIDIAALAANALVRGEEPRFGFLGISGTEPPSGRAGALVNDVRPGTPASSAGLRSGDLITRFGRERVEGMAELAALIRRTRPGTNVTLEVLRKGRSMRIPVEVGSE